MVSTSSLDPSRSSSVVVAVYSANNIKWPTAGYCPCLEPHIFTDAADATVRKSSESLQF